ncbi:MAG: ABC transporter permease [Lachnospiraceae bacterium]|nr:ABC transporter permease [Lachnospiraceae bacterium]
MKQLKSLKNVRWLSSLAFLIVLYGITGIINPSFLSYSSILSCFNSSVVFTLLAMGIAFVIMTGEIDVSIGSVMGLTATIAGLIAQKGGSPVQMLIYAVLVGIVTGMINGLGVAFFNVPSLIFTLGTCGVIRGLVFVVADGKTTENFAGPFTNLGSKVLFANITMYFALVFILAVIVHLLLTRTKKGKYFIAVGDNPNGANLVGISVLKTKMIAYILCGIFAGISGVAFASKYGQVNIVAGTGYEMSAIAACVLGGISLSGGLGNMAGAAIGAVIMSSVSRLLVFIGLSSDYDNTITGVMLITIVVVDALMQHRSVEMARRKRLLSRTMTNETKEGGEEA